MEKETCTFSYCAEPEIIEHETDILLIGGGMACCGAAYEAARWATPKGIKITMVDKAATDRSGAVAMGLSAINTYMGENDPADYVQYVKKDLMGIIREDLVYDLGRHVDDSVHLFEEWGLPIWKTLDDGKKVDGAQGKKVAKPLKEGGKPVRSGRWQIMINGESYKVIVAEAAKKALEYNRQATGVAENHFERVFIVKLLADEKVPNRVAAAVGFSVREHKAYIFKAKVMLIAGGGCVNVFRPRSTGEGMGRTWFAVWNAGSTYAMPAELGAKMVLMENRFVPARFKDGYGPVGAWFLFFKAKATNALGEDYCATHHQALIEKYGSHAEILGTCLRNSAMMDDMKAGKGPIWMRTDLAFEEAKKTMDAKELKHLEAEAWEDFLDMTIAQAGLWAANNVRPEEKESELMPSEPYLLGSHAGCAGLWCSGPEDLDTPQEYKWGYNRMTTIDGLFTAGDGCGASGHKFSSGSHAEGRIAGKEMVRYVLDHQDFTPTVTKDPKELAAEIFLPFEIYEKYKTYTTDPQVNPHYIRPRMLQMRLQKIMDEYVAGAGYWYMTSKTMLEEGLRQLAMLKEDAARMAAADHHELMRCWENYHRIVTGEAHARHILFREETRYPGYYYRGDFPKIDDENWNCFTVSRINPETGEWEFEKIPYVPLKS
jgi:adenylylsulfate reductase subunit A